MKLISSIIHRLRSHLVATANDDDLIDLANAEDGPVFRLAEDGTFFVPFGDHRHAKGLQRFDRESAEELQASANSATGRLLGIPIYAGHPDVKGREDTNPAAPAYGWLDLDGFEIENDGARFRPRWNKRGKESVENAEFRFYSPHWLSRKVGNLLKPVRLLSFGLTNRPNIPVSALANDDDTDRATTTTENDMTKEQLEKLGLAEDATPEQIKARLDTLVKAENDLAEKTTKLTTAENDLAAKETALATANDRAETARKTLVTAALDRAVLAGRMPEGDRSARETELLAIENDADLTAKLTELETIEKALKTTAVTDDLKGAKATIAAENDATARSEKRRELVAAELTAIANDTMPPNDRYNLAWQRAQRKSPEIFS